MDLNDKIRTLPTRPGVYLYKNADDEVIYVGKAKNLRSRVRSYFLEASQANAKTGSLMREAVDLEYILVDNEHEALALENNLIKQRKPRFNILLRDDKTYPYVKLTLGDRFPKCLSREGCAKTAAHITDLTFRATSPIASPTSSIAASCCPVAKSISPDTIPDPACNTTSSVASVPA
jgi:excinuclease UvrABC nuclease subunit